jgi:glycosyltransferase involved in cell wall biosynthesis
MKQILHILDDVALGGVTRLLASLIESLGDVGEHHRCDMPTKLRLAPRLSEVTPGGVHPDVIVLHFTSAWTNLPFLASLRLRAGSTPIIFVEHSYTEAYERRCVPDRSRFRAMLRLHYGLVDKVVAVSKGQARWLRESGLVDADRLAVIPCVLDLTGFSGVPDAKPLEGAPMRLGCFGRFAPQKGFDTLIAAMALVSPEVATLDMAGYGPDEAELRRAAQGLEHVRIQGAVDPVAYLADIDAVVMPSRWEAGAVTCWEARAAGRPVIVADVDGLPEQVPPEIGVIVPSEDPVGLAEAIRAMAAADRAAMALAARRSTRGAYAATLAGWRKVLTAA